ncbi:hypothetical protein CJ186_05155 [Actinomyces graevenitzii]|jgi:hypothetical protein|uniref:hypothetical protein n=1 Tax=Actinomyces graevenitzii TaxID=55565 RepID=UPI000C80CD54|nr:hypothetical protein [Actinomyces graevenitzii]PMC91484.1 hypothetical protein CJ186_05155 [Actinomyces graevenitzii]
MARRVLAIARTSSDEQAMTRPFKGLADVELIDASSGQARAVIARYGIKAQPAWLYPLGESVIVAVGSPEPIVQRLREQLAREMKPGLDQNHQVHQPSQSQDKQVRDKEPGRRLTRQRVLEMMEGRADQLHPVTQVSRINRRLSMERTRTRGSESE